MYVGGGKKRAWLPFVRAGADDGSRPAAGIHHGGWIECPLCVHTAAREQPYSDIFKAIFAVHLRLVVFARLRGCLFRAEETFRPLLNYFGAKDNQERS